MRGGGATRPPFLGKPGAGSGFLGKGLTMAINAEHLADAYEHVARVNHYLVTVVACSDDERDAAEQVLITRDNAAGNKNKRLNLALDILENDRRMARAA